MASEVCNILVGMKSFTPQLEVNYRVYEVYKIVVRAERINETVKRSLEGDLG